MALSVKSAQIQMDWYLAVLFLRGIGSVHETDFDIGHQGTEIICNDINTEMALKEWFDCAMPGLYKVYISDFETSQSGSIFSWADQWNVIEIENQQTFKSYSLKILPCRYHYWETNVLYYQYRHRQKYCITIVITFCVTFTANQYDRKGYE